MQPRQWQRQDGDQSFVVATDPGLISQSFVQDSFAGPSMYWAGPISQDSLDTILKNSCFFGLYVQTFSQGSKSGQQEKLNHSTLEQIGMARLVTDYATIAFLTDVFVSPEFQGKGLAKWMMRCVKELTDAMPEIRRLMFMAKRAPHAIKFYEDALDAAVHDQEKSHVVFMSTDNTPRVDA